MLHNVGLRQKVLVFWHALGAMFLQQKWLVFVFYIVVSKQQLCSRFDFLLI